MTRTNCTECDGGWRPVSEKYAMQAAGIDPRADLADYEAADRRSDAGAAYARFRGRLNTVYPCPLCRRDSYERWKAGCYRPGHKPCTICN